MCFISLPHTELIRKLTPGVVFFDMPHCSLLRFRLACFKVEKNNAGLLAPIAQKISALFTDHDGDSGAALEPEQQFGSLV